MAVALTFMAVITGMFFLRYYAAMITPTHKILYAGTVVNFELHPLNRLSRRASAATNKPIHRALDKMQVGVALQNSASFPISVLLAEANTEMDGRKPPRSLFPKKPVLVFQGNVVTITD